MKRLLSLLAIFLAAAFSLPAAADHLDGVVPLVKDDIAAVAQVKSTPERHVLLYFGDHLN
ncbi:MAG: hypothetical protein FD157_2752 [Rhodocyclaceae bacterium]|jgi:hypothetical protein|nr:MAG: hypothetical protein FD157_2752 [Rhodocyclaceae bacterium]TND04644.1 MAG: hypothetical protein FD118_850 [Rhodocyclaceae bacterium]